MEESNKSFFYVRFIIKFAFQMKNVLFIVLIVIANFTSKQSIAGADKKMSVQVGGVNRSYLLHCSKDVMKSTEKVPLVIVLQGGVHSAKDMITVTNFDKKADKDKSVVVYPIALDNHWNDGRKVQDQPGMLAYKEQDDVTFIDEIIKQVLAKYPVDKDRVFVTGIANGAMMCYRLACELSDKISAIAPVLGAMPSDIANDCKPKNGVHVIAINGAEDPLVPFKGGEITSGTLKLGKIEPVIKTMEFWANFGSEVKANKVRVTKKDMDHTDGTTVVTETYSNSKYEKDIKLFEIKGGGHAWPGAVQFLPPTETGKVSREINASDEIWKFFQKIY